MDELNPIGPLIMAVGAFAVAGGLSHWPWFWNSFRARSMVNFFGRGGARTVYVVIGALLIVAGIWATIADVNF